MNIDAKFVAEALSELISAQQEAFGIVTAALCRQVDPEQLKADIGSILSAPADRPPFHPVAVRLAEGAMAAADAQLLLNGEVAAHRHVIRRNAAS